MGIFTPIRRMAALVLLAAAFLCVDATNAAAQADAGPLFSFLSPPLDSKVGPLLYVTVDVAVAVTGVHARAGTVEFDLKPMGRAWSGSADISSLPRGPQTVVVTATNSLGETISASLPVDHDDVPAITITTPLHDEVARPDLHVVATCHDDDAAGCLNFKATVGTRSVSGTASIDTVFPLGAEDGQQTALEVTATDSAGQTVFERRDIYVDSSASLLPAVSVDGHLFDVDAARAIYLRQGSVVVRDRKTLSDVVVGDMDPYVAVTIGARGPVARLTSTGAAWLARGGLGGTIGCTNVTAFAWRDG
jgi:type IV secretory pathway VirB2 component (pilin)